MPSTLAELLAGKRFGLVLSAGFFGFYGHAGFLAGLVRAGFQPAAYAGTSAGGLVGAFAAAGMDPEEIARLVLAQNRAAFWDPDPIGAVLGLARGGAGASGLLKGERFRALLERELPVNRFESCRTPLLLVATNLTRGASEVFTAGALAPAVHATCAYPGLFRATEHQGQLYWDGGLVDKAPALALGGYSGAGLDAIVVHYLPSHVRETLGRGFAYVQGMAAAMAAIRRDHFSLQLEALKQRGVPVYTVVSRLPPVSPRSMEKGRDALEAARAAAVAALAAPPAPFDAH